MNSMGSTLNPAVLDARTLTQAYRREQPEGDTGTSGPRRCQVRHSVTEDPRRAAIVDCFIVRRRLALGEYALDCVEYKAVAP